MIMEHNSDSNQILRKIESIDRTISTISELSKALANMREEHWQLLDETTRPITPTNERAQTVRRGFEYRGDVSRRRYLIDIYLEILRRLWLDFPDQRKDMAEAMSARGHTRCYVSLDRASLFRNEPKSGVENNSVEFVEGWFADKCLSARWMHVVLAAAVRAVGLKWNQDVRIVWPARVQ
jgi:hypothetical protein